ncbi:outer membrane transport energization protein ExbB (TC 2.C.1.1.1) [Oceanospirillum multiglobuliferum]|uniref:MotA/TolQ/ExbB proton channel domain-containing protein n=1 Tax=Oceanospirillum multiglobuliferum TaxID=64969 RepID=A0A1T4NAE6_9GAMM|nr:MotA/TolQ/ExbB proton channel family protein [Oceanospirillum multiglobuliferum]OPX55897.1 hypothetical protein BTE48_06805 [Oceanospirillum multiglobuliferum]SJZ76222.1 outer membrane transport energization protein ExbB (TC 2.C.1.1.1) [Oceanospirillum multiglobuliferum]
MADTNIESSVQPLASAEPSIFHEGIAAVLDFLILGGPVVWLLSLFSLLATALVVVKLWQFSRLKPEQYSQVDRALQYWQLDEPKSALAILHQAQQQSSTPVLTLFSTGMQGIKRSDADEVQIMLLREELDRQASSYLYTLRTYLRPLELIASLSPLLGLLGTVLGMIGAFQQMEAAGSQVDPSVLSGGIWQALLTTAVGLTVAIPVLMAHTALERKAERVASQLQQRLTLLFTTPLLCSIAGENESPSIEAIAASRQQSDINYHAQRNAEVPYAT